MSVHYVSARLFPVRRCLGAVFIHDGLSYNMLMEWLKSEKNVPFLSRKLEKHPGFVQESDPRTLPVTSLVFAAKESVSE